MRPTKLFWVDLEMTGLDPAKDAILEIAAIVTDFDFKELARYEAVIHQPEAVLAAGNEWARAQHEASGLTDRVRREGRPEETVEHEVAACIIEHFGTEPAILAGNSIHSDRNFIRAHWPAVNTLLHYRMLDVSSLKVYMQGRYDMEYKKEDKHRALHDIEASIAEWQYYIRWLSTHVDHSEHPASDRA